MTGQREDASRGSELSQLSQISKYHPFLCLINTFNIIALTVSSLDATFHFHHEKSKNYSKIIFPQSHSFYYPSSWKKEYNKEKAKLWSLSFINYSASCSLSLSLLVSQSFFLCLIMTEGSPVWVWEAMGARTHNRLHVKKNTESPAVGRDCCCFDYDKCRKQSLVK